MNDKHFIPRILIIDDLFGRTHMDRRNKERSNLCGQYLIEDITDDEKDKGALQRIKDPVAQAVFYRGQTPICSTVDDIVENDLQGTLKVIQNGWQSNRTRWAMVLLDLCFYTGHVTEASNQKTMGMPEGRTGDDDRNNYFGLRVLKAIHNEFPDLPVIILSSKPREDVSREFSQNGALGFLDRTADSSSDLLKDYIWRHGLTQDDTGEIVGHSKSLLLALRAARRMASDRRNILIRGERGTGKELLAHYIHRKGQKEKGRLSPFIIVNSSILTSELFASVLFGIEEKVATDVMKRKGLIEEANGGNLFLDEIKDMLPQVQAGILRVLELHEITPIGSREVRPVDVRFLSATNADIEALSAADKFRTDLLDRLREMGTIFLPPLRERREDIPLLVEKFVRDAERANPNALKREIDSETLEMLYSYDCPGNIRMLRSCIFNAVNNNPDVEHLAPIHIQFPENHKTSEDSMSVTPPDISSTRRIYSDTISLDELIRTLDSFTFESAVPLDITGRLSNIQRAYARFIARYLRASLEATRKPTPEEPKGQIFIHPAVKLMTGDSKLTASKAADLIKRLLSISHTDIESLLSDPILKSAYETAIRLRPKGAKKKDEK